jgi:hypothetical protein
VWHPTHAYAALDAFLDWYETERAEDVVPLDHDGDLLLFQWGTGNATFDYDITRQFTVADDVDDDAIWQLHLTLHFEPSIQTRLLGAGIKWCSHPRRVHEFKEFVTNAEATQYARSEDPIRLDLTMDGV